MTTNLKKYREDLDKLVEKGFILYYTMAYDLKILDKESLKKVEKIRVTNFKSEYEKWYTESLSVIRQIIPDRQADFIKMYKDEKRKIADYSTYTMSDYLIGVQVTQGHTVKVDATAAVPKLEQQRNILGSANVKFESTLLDIQHLLHADLLDSEIEEASILLKNGYNRASGAIAGVVLESHLSQVCQNHKVVIKKLNPSISDYNDLLKNDGVYDIAIWRYIQHLTDLRNMCDHKKVKDPTAEEIEDLIKGVAKITKTIF
jgi:hypothetical protein